MPPGLGRSLERFALATSVAGVFFAAIKLTGLTDRSWAVVAAITVVAGAAISVVTSRLSR